MLTFLTHGMWRVVGGCCKLIKRSVGERFGINNVLIRYEGVVKC